MRRSFSWHEVNRLMQNLRSTSAWSFLVNGSRFLLCLRLLMYNSFFQLYLRLLVD